MFAFTNFAYPKHVFKILSEFFIFFRPSQTILQFHKIVIRLVTSL